MVWDNLLVEAQAAISLRVAQGTTHMKVSFYLTYTEQQAAPLGAPKVPHSQIEINIKIYFQFGETLSSPNT